jgi:hypothetical protein
MLFTIAKSVETAREGKSGAFPVNDRNFEKNAAAMLLPCKKFMQFVNFTCGTTYLCYNDSNVYFNLFALQFTVMESDR